MSNEATMTLANALWRAGYGIDDERLAEIANKCKCRIFRDFPITEPPPQPDHLHAIHYAMAPNGGRRVTSICLRVHPGYEHAAKCIGETIVTALRDAELHEIEVRIEQRETRIG